MVELNQLRHLRPHLQHRGKSTDWGLGDFGTSKLCPAAPTSKHSYSSGNTLWDIDLFSEPAPSTTHQSNSQPDKVDDHFNSPNEDFDFGSHEDSASRGYSRPNGAQQKSGLLNLDDNRGGVFDDVPDTLTGLLSSDENDFLGFLAKPVEAVLAVT